MSGIYDSIYATMLAEGRSYEDISQSVERLHDYLSGSHIDHSYEYQPRCASCNRENARSLPKHPHTPCAIASSHRGTTEF